MCGTCRTMRQKEGGEAILRVCAITILNFFPIKMTSDCLPYTLKNKFDTSI